MSFDGSYTEPAPDDPIAGVVMTHFEADPGQRRAVAVFTYFRKSGAVVDDPKISPQRIEVMADEFDQFALKLWPTMDFGKACVNALLYRLPNVSLPV